MQYSIIYSVDVPTCCEDPVRISDYLPKNRKPWTTTEDDSNYEYDYLEGDWLTGKHRKLCGILNQKQFDKFIDEMCLLAENVETMGSIGAPGFGFGHVPAISFMGDTDHGYGASAIQSAYVTPFDDAWTGDDHPEWEDVRKEIIEKYGY